MKTHSISMTVIAITTLLALPIFAQETEFISANLKLLWLTPLILTEEKEVEVLKPSVFPKTKGLSLQRALMRPDGRIVFLGEMYEEKSQKTVLITDIEHDGFQKNIELKLVGNLPQKPKAEDPRSFLDRMLISEPKINAKPGIGSLSVAGDETIWIGGTSNSYMDIASSYHSDLYIAKLDGFGKPIWERSYAAGRSPSITSIAPTENGDIIVASKESFIGPSLVSLVNGNDGSMIWEHSLVQSKGIALTALKENKFIVTSIEKDIESKDEHVVVRSVSFDGQIGEVNIVRRFINDQPIMNFGHLKASTTNDGAYILSGWPVSYEIDPSLRKPYEIAKVSIDGTLLWSKILPNSFSANKEHGGAKFCHNPALTTLTNGDAMVACTLGDKIHLHQFDTITGYDKRASIPIPECNDAVYIMSIFLFAHKNGTILLGGSQFSLQAGHGCSWLGELSLK